MPKFCRRKCAAYSVNTGTEFRHLNSRITNNSIISPRYLLYFNVGKFNTFNVSMYDLFKMALTFQTNRERERNEYANYHR